MGNSFHVDRVGMEIKREVNEILQKKVQDPRARCHYHRCTNARRFVIAKIFTLFIQPWPQITKKAQTGLEKATGTNQA